MRLLLFLAGLWTWGVAQGGWHEERPYWRSSPVNVSFLNAAERPAGKHGFLLARGGRLVFEDGTQVRFWGTTISARALFQTNRRNVKQQAKRLSALGFNLVRLHHHDSPWVEPNIFGHRPTNTQKLSAEMQEKLDWWITCLKSEGIYVWLDLHVQRSFTSADGIDGYEELAQGKRFAALKGFNYVNPSIVAAMKRFNAAFLLHRNKFTGLRYIDDPAIVVLLITNENDVTNHYGRIFLREGSAPEHRARYLKAFTLFTAQHRLPQSDLLGREDLHSTKLFMNELEHRFDVDMIEHLRSLGAKVPIATTSFWGFSPLSSLPSLTTGDIVDVHSYGGAREIQRNPLNAPNLMHWIAAAHVAGRPLTVSEWNVEQFPVPDRALIPLFLAASACLQGWDGLLQYAYSVGALNSSGIPSNWHAFNDPAMLASLPAAALLYRRHDVREASTIYAFVPSEDALFRRSISPANSVALRTAAEKGKLVVALPRIRELAWVEQPAIPPEAVRIRNPQLALISPDASNVTSDTGELRHDWRQGTFTIDTPRTQAALGSIGDKTIILRDVEIRTSTPDAMVAVQSLDQTPIVNSRAILVSLAARSTPLSATESSFSSESIDGEVSIRAPVGLKLYIAAARDDERPRRRDVAYKNGRYRLRLHKRLASHWLILK